MGKLDGKVAFITGAARGQGRSHAIRLAQEGADIIAVDIVDKIGSVLYPMPTPEDLAQTVKEVEALDRRIVATQTDVRDFAALKSAVDDGVAQLGRLDIVAANAGIAGTADGTSNLSEAEWQDMIDINLTGVWHATKAAVPHLLAGGRGGSIVLTSSAAGLMAYPNIGHYVAAKHGVVGLTKTAAIEYAKDGIRVNCVNPGYITTPMTEEIVRTRIDEVMAKVPMNRMGVPEEIAEAVVWMCSDKASFMTGASQVVDGGYFAA
jgi:(+)-trans-carveol dehydrogenase